MKILELSAIELAKKIKRGELSVTEAAKASLAQIAKEDPKIHAYLTVDAEKVLAQAREVEEGIRAGKYTGPLAGVPIAVKDNICTKGMKTTCASKILENFVPFYDATAVTRITEAGMVILGKTNMDEFAMGSTTETSAFAVTKNPWDTEHVPGGSSGGSCAAGAAREGFAALGFHTRGIHPPPNPPFWGPGNKTNPLKGFPFWACGFPVPLWFDRTDR